MRTAIISFTEHGALLAQRLQAGFSARGIECGAWLKKKDACPPEGVRRLEEPLSDWTGRHFADCGALVFIGAAGIAVRSVAPFVKDKKTDPAVIAADEQGRYVIPLLSGHIGGANRLALLAAEILGAEPVITTATDRNGKFAVDEFAARRGLYMDSMPYAKEIASRLVEGKRVGMRSAYPLIGRVPEELNQEGDCSVGFSIGVCREQPFAHTLHLVPKTVVLGVGCKKGMDARKIRLAVEQTLTEYGVFLESVRAIASIDLKKEEPGLLTLAEELQVPFVTWTAEELSRVQAEGLKESAFVRSVTGVGNVCGRAALLGAGAKRLLIPKTALEGVTVAAAEAAYTVCMED